MRIVFICGAIIGLSASSSFGDDLAGQLVLESDAAVIEIPPQAPGLRLIHLPEISFAMQIEVRCGSDLLPESVSISVADTRVNLGSAELADQGIVQKTIRVPARQIAPLTIENFCIADDTTKVATPVQVRDALSAQVSLKCAAAGRQSMVYQTVALSVALTCRSPEDKLAKNQSPDYD